MLVVHYIHQVIYYHLLEVWDFISDQDLDYFSGNVIKYVCRAGHKDDELTDLKKAKAYIDKRIELLS